MNAIRRDEDLDNLHSTIGSLIWKKFSEGGKNGRTRKVVKGMLGCLRTRKICIERFCLEANKKTSLSWTQELKICIGFKPERKRRCHYQ